MNRSVEGAVGGVAPAHTHEGGCSMTRRFSRALLLGVLLLALAPAPSANAEIAPPWCGTPSADAAENLPDEAEPEDPVGIFPHIPYYAVGCTLRDIEDDSRGRMDVD